MRRADSQLRKPTGTAVDPMRQAADALVRAADARPSARRAAGSDRPAVRRCRPRTDTPPAEIVGRFDKPWGELPGDVQSKILQELAAKYGEDYARTIKLYFESLAERK